MNILEKITERTKERIEEEKKIVPLEEVRRQAEEKGIKDQNMTQMINDLIIYPTDFFSPKNFTTKQLEITSNTYSIHHYQNSWNNDCDVYKRDLKSIIWRLLTNESK